jgi:hypothetical protein
MKPTEYIYNVNYHSDGDGDDPQVPNDVTHIQVQANVHHSL